MPRVGFTMDPDAFVLVTDGSVLVSPHRAVDSKGRVWVWWDSLPMPCACRICGVQVTSGWRLQVCIGDWSLVCARHLLSPLDAPAKVKVKGARKRAASGQM